MLFGCQAMSTKYFPSSGSLHKRCSSASIARVVSFLPRSYTASSASTTGYIPFHLVVDRYPSTAATELSSPPFQCFSTAAQHRSTGLYLL